MPVKTKPTAGIILAAGRSTRFGRPKQLLKLKQKYLLEWVIDAALSSRLQRTFLVLGDNFENILQALGPKSRHPSLEVVFNPRFSDGQSHSLRVGLLAAKAQFPSVMFLLGDQPLVDTGLINHLLEKFWNSNKEICVPVHLGQRGNPTLFSRNWYQAIEQLTGDTGARKIIDTNPDHVLEAKIDCAHAFTDVDTPENFKALKSYL